MFIDEARIRVKAGDGGNGCMAFRREKFVPRGGPSGGDGGRGGDVIMQSSQRHNTLIHFRYNPEHKAQRGEHGMGSNCSGLDGKSIILQVPIGTALYDQDTGELIHDFQEPDEQVVIAKGGRGGRGNQHFATSVHQAPREHELGRPGEERNYRLELKLLADVGLVGYPNAGKSTLISRISAAKPSNFEVGKLFRRRGPLKKAAIWREKVVLLCPKRGKNCSKAAQKCGFCLSIS
jgi:GTP-binding protein